MIPLQRVRVRFRRSGQDAAALTHLQQIDSIRRALLNSGWPVATADGKKKRVKASFGPAISVGYESECEYCDVELASRLPLTGAKENLEKHLPAGYSVVDIKSIPRFFPSLDQTLNAASYELVTPLLTATRGQWDDFWKKDHVMVVKKKADGDIAIDARACVRSWTLDNDRLVLGLRFGPGRTLKPERITQAVCGWDDAQVAFDPSHPTLKIKRLKLYMEKIDGTLVEP